MDTFRYALAYVSGGLGVANSRRDSEVSMDG